LRKNVDRLSDIKHFRRLGGALITEAVQRLAEDVIKQALAKFELTEEFRLAYNCFFSQFKLKYFLDENSKLREYLH